MLLLNYGVYAQKNYTSATIAFYNVENLFDTEISAGYIDGTKKYTNPDYHISIAEKNISKYDTVAFYGPYTYEAISGKKIIRPIILQEEFSPAGAKVWTKQRYNQKLTNLSRVIAKIGSDVTQTAPVIVGLCEVENREVVEDLVNHETMKPYDYGVVHFNSFDKRGVDVALIYQKSRFQVTEAKPYVLIYERKGGGRDYTRDILRVTGLLDGEEITFLVNHWPSRSGGEAASMPGRIKAAQLMKSIFEEIKAGNPDAKIIAMGDFNDDPVSESLKNSFKAEGNKEKVKKDGYFNPMIQMYKKGMGTLAYRDSWNLFDQIITTGTLVDQKNQYKSYAVYKTGIYNPDFLIAKEGQYKGYPHRMFSGDTYRADGTSDHFPVYTILLREAQ